MAWRDNRMYCRAVLKWTAHLVSSEHVHDRLAAALADRPSLVQGVLAGVAQWIESRDMESVALLGIRSGIRNVPEWLPAQAVVTAVSSQIPEVRAGDVDGVGVASREIMVAQLLWIVEARLKSS